MITSPQNDLSAHRIVSGDEWLAARKVLLAKEKEATRLRDELARARRDLPWERVEKDYLFHGPHGPQTLAQIFGNARQLIVYHFMFDPQWNEGCKSCSFWADTFDGIPVHLKARDIAFAAISRAPYDRLEPYRKRMGWSFTWLSSFENDFNHDFGVTFSQAEVDAERTSYNYTVQGHPQCEAPGVSVFYKPGDGAVFHTYSTYGRGIDILNAAYNYIDLAPKGRDEGDASQSWVRRHDEYDV